MTSEAEHREQFIKRRPWICHVSLANDVACIHRHGLLSTSALLDLFEITDEDRHTYEQIPRPKAVPLAHSRFGSVRLNDQSPLTARGLRTCLDDGLSIAEWCKELNSRVYFRPAKSLSDCEWKTKPRASETRITLVAETRAFLDAYDHELDATAINPGYTMRKPVRRGSATFRPLRQCFQEERFSIPSIAELSLKHKMNKTHLFREIGL